MNIVLNKNEINIVLNKNEMNIVLHKNEMMKLTLHQNRGIKWASNNWELKQ